MHDGAARPQEEPQAGVGISSIRARLRRWGGHLSLESGADGAVLVADVPVPSQQNAAAPN